MAVVNGLRAIALLFTLVFVGAAWAQATVELTAADDGKTIELAVGQKATLTLKMNAGTGYLWELAAVDEKILTVGEKQIEANSSPGLVGGPVIMRFPLTAQAAGKVTLSAQLVRPWQKEKPAATVTIHIIVK